MANQQVSIEAIMSGIARNMNAIQTSMHIMEDTIRQRDLEIARLQDKLEKTEALMKEMTGSKKEVPFKGKDVQEAVVK